MNLASRSSCSCPQCPWWGWQVPHWSSRSCVPPGVPRHCQCCSDRSPSSGTAGTWSPPCTSSYAGSEAWWMSSLQPTVPPWTFSWTVQTLTCDCPDPWFTTMLSLPHTTWPLEQCLLLLMKTVSLSLDMMNEDELEGRLLTRAQLTQDCAPHYWQWCDRPELDGLHCPTAPP